MSNKTYFLPFSTIETNTHTIYSKFLKSRGNEVINIPKGVDLQLLKVEDGLIIPPTIITEKTFLNRIKTLSPKLLTKKALLAIKTAKKVHSKQNRRNGVSYMEGHIYPVTLYYVLCEILYGNGAKEETFIVCLLHDCIEDGNGNVLYESNSASNGVINLRKLFGKKIAQKVLTLTKKSKKFYIEKYPKLSVVELEELRNKEYVANLAKSAKDVILIKCIDRILNLSNDIEFHKKRDAEKIKEYVHETQKYYSTLFNRVNEYYKDVYILTITILEKLVN